MRLFLTLVAGSDSYADLVELFDTIKEHFDGLCAVYHGERDDLEAKYLEIVKGEGRIIYMPYVGRHDLSRICAVHCGAIKEGDVVCQFDTLERLSPEFANEMLGLLDHSINTLFYYGKVLLYEYHESVTFQGTPHEAFRRMDGGMKAVELSRYQPDESKVRLNVRPLKRTDPYHWLSHYIRYYLATPWGANHCLLGNEHRGDPIKLYHEREVLRIEVRDYLRAQGVPLTVDGLREHFKKPLIEPMIRFINQERILNDAYRYWVLNDLTVKDDHTWAGMVQILAVLPNPLDVKPQAG